LLQDKCRLIIRLVIIFLNALHIKYNRRRRALPQLPMYTRNLALIAIVSATVLVLVTASLTADSVLAVRTGTNPKSTTSPNKDLKNLVACESTAAKGPGGLTQDGLVNCYTQTFSGNSAIPPVAVAPDFGSANTTYHNSSTSHTHHHSSAKSSSSPSAAALSGLG
jgi:hypothetical protein